MHESSLDTMRRFRETHLRDRLHENLLVLDLGSFDVNGSYRELFSTGAWTYRGLDMYGGRNVDLVLSNPYDWKEIPTNSADVLISGQAFEHIEYIWIAILEIRRVLKPGGLCCIIAPSAGEEHQYPVDCWRFYPDGFGALARYARLEILELKTKWEPDSRFTDDSYKWRDTFMVCRKNQLSFSGSVKERILFGALHKIQAWSLR